MCVICIYSPVPWYPSSVRLIAINSSAIEVQWRHPSFGSRGGIIRGYKIFVQLANGRNETVIDTQTNATVYVIGGLMCNTSYAISVLAYTGVGDGPKSKRQTTSTLGT